MTDVTDRIARLCILLQDPGAGTDFAAAGADGVRQHLVTAMETAAADPELTAALDDLDDRMAAADYGHVTRTTRAFRSQTPTRLYGWIMQRSNRSTSRSLISPILTTLRSASSTRPGSTIC